MLRLCNNPTRRRRYLGLGLGLLHPRRPFSTIPKDSTSHSTQPYLQNSNSHHHPPALHRHPTSLSPLSPSPVFSRTPLLALSLSLTVAASASAAYLLSSSDGPPSAALIYDALRRTADAIAESCSRILHRMSLTASAASVLWQSLSSVLSSANHEVRSGFELRVAALLADISAANPSRRSALVGAGGGAVLDWLLEKVSSPGGGGVENCATEAEAARALAYLLADPNVCEAVLGRPHAIPNLLRFIFSFQPQKSNQHSKHRPMNVSEYFKGKSMLVAAIMDIVTSSCDSRDKVSFQPSLSESAKMKDIAIAIQVIEEGGMHLDENPGEDDNDKGKGMKGIGIKILGEATVLGLSRTSGLMKLEHSDANNGLEPVRATPKTLALPHKYNDLLAQPKSSSAAVPGLWDDLHCQHVAVPFAAWALANWAMASELNRSHIQELDQDGYAVMTALMAPERTVKWHGSLVARLLLEDRNLPLNDSISDWSATLLSTVSHASKIEDIPLAQLALSAFLVSVERSSVARKVIMDRGLHLMRESAQRTRKHKHVQESLAKALELLCNGDMHFPFEESQKWSGILLSWVFGQNSSDMVQDSATKILSFILEDHGPYSVPISQGWLALLLTEILDTRKSTSVKGETQPKSDKVKTQIDQSNTIFAAQTANQVAGAVVNLAGNQLGTEFNSANSFPLEDLLSLEPFARPFKNLKKDALPKFDAADSAMATLKGIKALTEVCAEDTSCQNKVADFGVLCLLRRFLLQDDYEKLAAIETYDASRAPEARDRVSHIPSESESVGPNNSSSVRVPPTAHIRKHAARLLTILSLLRKVQNVILEDETWCKWLEECANGNIPGCNDPKIQSYARATLLNISCRDLIVRSSADGDSIDSFINKSSICPRYSDMLFLINPELPHWKCTEKHSRYIDQWGSHFVGKSPQNDNEAVDYEVQHVSRISSNDGLSTTSDSSNRGLQSGDTLVDVVFVHGLRGGPYKTWRISDDKSSTKSGLVEKIDQEAGKQGTFWPAEWLSSDFSEARLFTLKYKTNLTQWSGASLPLQEVSSMLLEKLVAAGIGNRPVVFVTHSMGGLVVKQMLFQAQAENNNLVNNTIGVVFYSCPHFGSKLADMPWRMGLVLRPAPTIGELRSGSSRLIELNELVRNLHRKRLLEVLSFCETKVTPIVEGYGGWAFRMEIVPIESAYPGFGELVVLDSTDHINSCKPINRTDPSYTEILNFLRKLISEFT